MGDRLRREIVAIAKRPENAECADCRFQNPTWASFNLGIFLCMNCAGVHRSLGTHITRVRSVTLDTWDQASVTFMGTVGNKIANQYWEAKLPAHARISPVADAPRRSEFIRQKYELRTWYGQPNTGGTDTTTSTQTITPEMSREQRRQQRLEQRKAGQLTSATPTPSASHAYAQVAAQPIQPTRSTSAPSFHAIAGADERAAAAAGLFAGMNVNSPNGNGHTHTNGNTAQRTTPPVTRTNARTRSASPWVQRPEGGNDEISMTTSTTTSNKPSSQPIDLFALPQTTTTLTHSQSANGDLFAGLTERDNTSTAPPIQLSSSLPETFNLMSLADPPTQHTSFLPTSTSTSTSTSLDLSNMQIRTEASPLDAFLQASNDTQPVSTYTHVQSASTPYAQPASTTFFPTQEPVQSSGFDFVHTTTTSSTPPAFGFLNETTTSSTTSTSTSSDDPFAHLYGADGTPQAIESQPSSTSTATSHHRINRYDVGMNRYGSPTTMGRKLSSGTHVCAVDGCGQVRVARGYCSKHINHVDDEPTSTPTTSSSSDDTSAFSFVSGSDDPFQSLPTSDPTPSLDLATPTPATQPLTPPQSTAPITTTTTGTAPSPVHYHHYAPYPYPPYPGYPPPPSAAAAPGQAPPTHPHAAPYPYPPYPYAPYPYPPPGAAAAPPAFPPHSTYPPNQQPPHTAYPPYPSYPGYPPHPQAYPGYPPASTTAPVPSPSPSPPPVAAAAPAPHDPFASFAAAMPGKAAPATAVNGNGSAFAFV